MGENPLVQISISVSEDNMAVIMSIPSECTQVELQDILDLLSENGVVYGINNDNIQMILEEHVFDKEVELASGEAAIDKEVEVAIGEVVEDGADAWLELFFDPAEKKPTPEMSADGSVDQHELNLIELVKAGDLLIKKHPLVSSNVDGCDVYGKKIKAHVGKDVFIKAGDNVELSENGLEAYAKVSGSLKWGSNKVSIETKLHVRGDVDFATGDIDFYGDVEIEGNVLNDFKVQTTGDILIKGVVEAATIIAGGTVTIVKGVLGRGNCYIQAELDVISGHIEAANVVSGRCVYVSSAIRHSNVTAKESIYCDKEDGAIIGGKLVAGKLVQARDVGTEIETPTVIKIGDVRDIEEKIKLINRHKEELEKQLQQIKEVQSILCLKLVRYKKGVVDADRLRSMVEHLKKLNSAIARQEQENNKLMSEIGVLNDVIEEKKDPKLSAEGNIFPGVKISLGHSSMLTKEIYFNKSIVVIDYEFYFLRYKDLDEEDSDE